MHRDGQQMETEPNKTLVTALISMHRNPRSSYLKTTKHVLSGHRKMKAVAAKRCMTGTATDRRRGGKRKERPHSHDYALNHTFCPTPQPCFPHMAVEWKDHQTHQTPNALVSRGRDSGDRAYIVARSSVTAATAAAERPCYR